jgi:hypothetical protein
MKFLNWVSKKASGYVVLLNHEEWWLSDNSRMSVILGARVLIGHQVDKQDI